jgi:hypothetical protein
MRTCAHSLNESAKAMLRHHRHAAAIVVASLGFCIAVWSIASDQEQSDPVRQEVDRWLVANEANWAVIHWHPPTEGPSILERRLTAVSQRLDDLLVSHAISAAMVQMLEAEKARRQEEWNTEHEQELLYFRAAVQGKSEMISSHRTELDQLRSQPAPVYCRITYSTATERGPVIRDRYFELTDLGTVVQENPDPEVRTALFSRTERHSRFARFRWFSR